jgi:two-component sensor histidine kinase
MSSSVVRLTIRSILVVALVSIVIVGCTITGTLGTAPIFALVCLAYAAAAIFGGRIPALAAVAIGTLELTLALPGEGFAVSDPDEAMGLIVVIATGCLIAWYVGRMETLAAEFAADVSTNRQTANWKTIAHSELTHRLSNDLSIMVSMASIKARQTKSPEAREALNDVSSRLIVLGRVYRRLEVRDRDIDDNIGAREFLYDLCGDLQLSTLSSSALALRLDVDDTLRLPIGTLSVVGLIANELLTNVHKHAFPHGEGGQVLLYFHRDASRPDCLKMIVTDDGVGFIDSPMRREGGGTSLLTMLASQIGGTLSYTRTLDTTVAMLRFAISSATFLDAPASSDVAAEQRIDAEDDGLATPRGDSHRTQLDHRIRAA